MWTRRLSEVGAVAALALVTIPGRADRPPAPAPTDGGSPASPEPGRNQTEDPLGPYRERFKQGMDRYKEGSLAEAIGYWEPVYRELGEEKGYRLAYNLGVAYAELGDATHAAERLQSFLSQVAARKERGEPVEGIVSKEVDDSEARVVKLMATRGRIRIDAGERPCATQVDASEARLAGYVAWVSPGKHMVTFSPATGNAASTTVDVGAGEVVTLSPPAPEANPTVVPLPSASGSVPAPSPVALAAEPPPLVREVTTHPFSPVVLATAGGLALAAAIVAVPLDMHAWSLRSSDIAEQHPNMVIPQSDRQAFADARTQAYEAIGVGIGLAALTAGLTVWYFAGARHHSAVATPSGIAWRF
jgi:hypothetical protein